jgi:hypothetical protein
VRQRPRTFARSARLTLGAAFIAAGGFAIAPMSAQAAAKVSGDAQAVSVEAQNSSIDEILAALGQKFKLRYRSSGDLNNTITGTYQGTLHGVVARLLEGRNFIMRSGPDGLEVIVFGNRAAPASTGVTSTAKSGPTPEPVQNAVAAEKTASQAPIAEQAHPATAKSGTHLPAPEVKVAQGPMPMPTPGPAGKSLPVPAPPSKSTNLVAPPVPAKDAPAAPAPEFKGSNAAPPVPPGLLAPTPKGTPQAGTTPKPEGTSPAGATPKPSGDK